MARRRDSASDDGFTTRRIYSHLRKLSRGVPKGDPLALTEDQFKGACAEFVAREVPRIIPALQAIRENSQPPDLAPMDRQSIDEAIVGRLETLCLRMYWARDPAIYDSAEKKFDHIIRRIKPKRRRLHAIKRDVLGFAKLLAKRRFFWAIMRGEWRLLQRKYHRPANALRKLRELYPYLPELGDENFKERVWTGSTDTLAREDVAADLRKRYDMKITAASLRTLLAPSKWYEG